MEELLKEREEIAKDTESFERIRDLLWVIRRADSRKVSSLRSAPPRSHNHLS